MWEPYSVDLSSIVKEGTNTLELILVNNLRNILGLHHRAEGECYSASPGKFYREKCVWSLDAKEEEWNNDYCFINLSLRNRKQEEL